MVHKCLLCQTSSYFQAALEGGFKEAAEQRITMPDQSPEVIERFVLWVYTGKLLGSVEDVHNLNRRQLADLYIVGDIYGIPDLQNSVMDCFVGRVNKCLSSKTLVSILHHVYENTPKDCCLRRFLVERAVTKSNFKGNWFEAYKVLYPQQYLMDIIVEFYRRRNKNFDDIDWNNLGCTYHVHPKDVAKPAEGHSDTNPGQGEERA